MRRVFILTVVAAATIAVALAIARADHAPQLDFDSTVPDDLRAVAIDAWDEFLAAHPARVDCIDPINLKAAWELDNRAEYHPGTATLVIRVPGTAPNLINDLTHEFAHHVEFTCPEHHELREAFLEAQDFPAKTPWFDGSAWETTPSEVYAEATIEAVLGRRTHHGGVHISDEAIAVVRKWGSRS